MKIKDNNVVLKANIIPVGKVDILNITPTTSAQTFRATKTIEGFNPVNISAVDSSIDSNIIENNIKQGVTILGVTGTLESGNGDDGIPRQVSNNVYMFPQTPFTFKLPDDAKDINDYVLAYAFTQYVNYNYIPSQNLTEIDLSNVENISGNYAMYMACYHCPNLTKVNLSNVKVISGNYSLYMAFTGNITTTSTLTEIDLSNLTTVSGNFALTQAFYHSGLTGTVNLSNLTTISGTNALDGVFNNSAISGVDLSKLSVLTGYNALANAFTRTNVTSISFPSLTSNSFGSYNNQFRGMLSGVTGCTVHFPSNLENVIGSWADVLAGFGGTNTTILFDLPATE